MGGWCYRPKARRKNTHEFPVRGRESVCEWQEHARIVCFAQIPEVNTLCVVQNADEAHGAARSSCMREHDKSLREDDVHRGRDWRGVALLRFSPLTSPPAVCCAKVDNVACSQLVGHICVSDGSTQRNFRQATRSTRACP